MANKQKNNNRNGRPAIVKKKKTTTPEDGVEVKKRKVVFSVNTSALEREGERESLAHVSYYTIHENGK